MGTCKYIFDSRINKSHAVSDNIQSNPQGGEQQEKGTPETKKKIQFINDKMNSITCGDFPQRILELQELF